LLNRTKEKTSGIIGIANNFNELLYDIIIPRFFNELYSLTPVEEIIEHEVELIKEPPPEKDIMRLQARKI